MKSIVIAIAAVALLTSCSMDPVHVEADFGSSVRQMIEGQIGDPETAAAPSPLAPDRLDGVGAEQSLTEYRRGAKRGDGAQPAIRLSVD